MEGTSKQEPQHQKKEEAEKKTDDKRNWLDLPEVALLSILARLFSIPDLFVFASVCRLWRSFAKSHAASTSRPPLLLQCLNHPEIQAHRTNRCRFRFLSIDLRPYEIKIRHEILTQPCVGYSYGHLIISFSEEKVVLINVFTGEEIHPPVCPSLSFISFGMLTSPLSSSSCMLLLGTFGVKAIMCWKPSTNQWIEFSFGSTQNIRSLATFKGNVFFIDGNSHLNHIHFDPDDAKYDRLGAQVSLRPQRGFRNFNKRTLVECNGELLLVLFLYDEISWSIKIEVHRFDFAGSVWVKMQSLGDWCLFVDPVRNSPMACPNPERWGGRSNCIYVVGPECDHWSVYPLDDKDIDTDAIASTECPLSVDNWRLSYWPSSVWVYPSMLIKN